MAKKWNMSERSVRNYCAQGRVNGAYLIGKTWNIPVGFIIRRKLIMFKECLKYNIVPFIIEDNLKMFYYRGLKEWDNEKGYLTDTCLTAQDKHKAYLDYFRIMY